MHLGYKMKGKIALNLQKDKKSPSASYNCPEKDDLIPLHTLRLSLKEPYLCG